MDIVSRSFRLCSSLRRIHSRFSSTRRSLHFVSCSRNVPHPQKLSWGGEDACVAGSHVLAVSDGVGGWQDCGVTSKEFAEALVHNISDLDAKFRSKPRVDEPELFSRKGFGGYQSYAYYLLLTANRNVETCPGSATAAIVTLRENEALYDTANIGDSGFWIFRDGHVMRISEESLHGFNHPYQLMAYRRGKRNPIADSVEDSLLWIGDAKPHDIVVLWTDGISDNVFLSDVETIVHRYASQLPPLSAGPAPLQVYENLSRSLCSELVDRAVALSLDRTHESPIQRSAKAMGYAFSGGKLDDITAVVAIVVP